MNYNVSQHSCPTGIFRNPPVCTPKLGYCSSVCLRDRFLEKEGCLERGAVAAEPADDLDAKRKAAVVVESRHVDARRAHQGPQPIECRASGRAETTRRRTRR